MCFAEADRPGSHALISADAVGFGARHASLSALDGAAGDHRDAGLLGRVPAYVLNVSRPYVIKLLDEKQIPYRMVGNRRRVLMADLLGYKEKDDEGRRKVLAELAAEGQEAGEY